MNGSYALRRYHLTLTTYAGIVPLASHWRCRLRWTTDDNDHEADAERGRGDNRTMRFDTEAAARRAGLRLARKLSAGGYYIVTEGSHCVLDPQPVLSAPGNLKQRLNAIYRAFDKLGRWDVPRSVWPAVTAVCDTWSRVIGQKWRQ